MGAPGLGEALRRARAASRRVLDAHLALLRAELSIIGREIGIVVGLAIGALSLAMLLFTLLYVGSFLFLGEWLFGSIGWGILHGALSTLALILGIGLNLAGGWLGAYGRGLAAGVLVVLLGSLLFASNVLREGAVLGGQRLEATLALEPALLPTLVGLVAGALLIGLLVLLLGWRLRLAGGAIGRLLLAGLLVGAAMGTILGSVTFDVPGAVAVSVTLGLLTWMASAVGLAARRGFSPEQRYARLMPRVSISAAQATRDLLVEQWQRQIRRVMGR